MLRKLLRKIYSKIFKEDFFEFFCFVEIYKNNKLIKKEKKLITNNGLEALGLILLKTDENTLQLLRIPKYIYDNSIVYVFNYPDTEFYNGKKAFFRIIVGTNPAPATPNDTLNTMDILTHLISPVHFQFFPNEKQLRIFLEAKFIPYKDANISEIGLYSVTYNTVIDRMNIFPPIVVSTQDKLKFRYSFIVEI